MRNFRRFTMLMGGVAGVSTLAACLVVGCSSEDTNVTGDAGKDQTTNDVVVTPDGGGSDVQTTDVNIDAPNPAAFEGQVVDAVCERIRSCCGTAANAFNLAECRRQVHNNGGVWGETVDIDFTDGGKVTYDPVKGAQCIAAIAALSCDNINGAAMIADRALCLGALTGTGAVGAGCRGAIECQTGNFCNLPLDGGAGTCAALRGDGGPCGDWGIQDPSQHAQHACSYRGNGATGLTCVVYDWAGVSDSSTGFLPPSMWSCQPQTADDAGANCFAHQDCKSGVCNDNNECGGSTYLVDDAGTVCGQYRITDAGGGG